MTVPIIDYNSIFSEEQIHYITEKVTEQARAVFADSLRDVILYGSYARGDFAEWSDVDIMILVDLDELTAKQLNRELTSRLSDLDERMNMLLSTIVVPFSRFEYFKDHYSFYINVKKEGIRSCLMDS